MIDIDRRDALLLATAAAASLAFADSATPQALSDNNIPMPNAFHGITGLSIPREMTVLGTGGFGSWPALFGALSGVESMLLIDGADVSADDLGRTPYREFDIGRPKVEALADIIHFFRPNVKIKTIKRMSAPTDDDVYFGSVMFNGTDDKPLADTLFSESVKRGLKYRHGFYNGHKAGTVDYAIEDIKYTRGGQVPVWPAVAALSGVLATYSAFVSPLNYYGTPDALNQDASVIKINVADSPAP